MCHDELFGLKRCTLKYKINTMCSISKLRICRSLKIIWIFFLLPLLFHLSLCQMEQPSMDQKGHANVPWIVEPGQEAKRGVNTKYETTIF